MADIRQRQTSRDGVESNPMNLTCKPVNSPHVEAATKSAAGAATKYALIMNGTGAAAPPNNTWSPVYVSTEPYELKNSDGTIAFTIPAGGLGIYSK